MTKRQNGSKEKCGDEEDLAQVTFKLIALIFMGGGESELYPSWDKLVIVLHRGKIEKPERRTSPVVKVRRLYH